MSLGFVDAVAIGSLKCSLLIGILLCGRDVLGLVLIGQVWLLQPVFLSLLLCCECFNCGRLQLLEFLFTVTCGVL